MALVPLSGTLSGTAGLAGIIDHSVGGLSPAAAETRLPPNSPITFTLYGTGAGPAVETFATWPTTWLRCTPENAFTGTWWNSGADSWSLYDDGGTPVLRTTSRATAVLQSTTHPTLPNAAADITARVRWFAGAAAGLIARADAFRAYGAAQPMLALAAEVDSGGFRLCFYSGGSRSVRKTKAFVPVEGEWYWIRLQSAGPWAVWYRAKVWTGTRAAEPAAWDLEEDDGLDPQSERWHGVGVHQANMGAVAYFTDVELAGDLSPDAQADLVVTINGVAHTVAEGDVTVNPHTLVEDWFPGKLNEYDARIPDLDHWDVTVRPRTAADLAAAGEAPHTITVAVVFAGVTLYNWSYTTASLPGPAPRESDLGDPSTLGSYRLLETPTPAGGRGLFFARPRPTAGADQLTVYTVAPFTFTNQAHDLRYVVATSSPIIINGRYLVAHPVLAEVPGGFVLGQPVLLDVPAGLIPKGATQTMFPGGLVVQGYRRDDFPGGFVPSVPFFYRGRAAGVVSVALLNRFRGSGIAYEVNDANEVEVHVLDAATYQALLDGGATVT